LLNYIKKSELALIILYKIDKIYFDTVKFLD